MKHIFSVLGIAILLFLIRGLFRLFSSPDEVYIMDTPTEESTTVITTGTTTTVDDDSMTVTGIETETTVSGVIVQ